MGAVIVEPEALVGSGGALFPRNRALAYRLWAAVGRGAVGSLDVAVLVGVGGGFYAHHAAEARRHGGLLGL